MHYARSSLLKKYAQCLECYVPPVTLHWCKASKLRTYAQRKQGLGGLRHFFLFHPADCKKQLFLLKYSSIKYFWGGRGNKWKHLLKLSLLKMCLSQSSSPSSTPSCSSERRVSLCPSSRLRMVRGSVGKVRLATVAHNTTNPFTIHKSTNHHNHHHQQTTTNTTRYQICLQDEDWTAFCAMSLSLLFLFSWICHLSHS